MKINKILLDKKMTLFSDLFWLCILFLLFIEKVQMSELSAIGFVAYVSWKFLRDITLTICELFEEEADNDI